MALQLFKIIAHLFSKMHLYIKVLETDGVKRKPFHPDLFFLQLPDQFSDFIKFPLEPCSIISQNVHLFLTMLSDLDQFLKPLGLLLCQMSYSDLDLYVIMPPTPGKL